MILYAINLPSLKAFMRDETIRHPTLVCPVRVLWRAYKAYCAEWGFEPATATEFMHWLRLDEGVTIKEGGRGRLHRVAVGLGTKQKEALQCTS